MMGIVQTGTNEGRGRVGVMLPVPGYSLYQARLLQHNSYQIHYRLDEESDWSLNVTELKRALEEARSYCVPRGLVLINPGNPTGQVLTHDNIREVIKFCARDKLVLFADEVYQENVYADGVQFHSCKKVLRDMGAEYRDFQLMSLHSSAKGYTGECGLRGGYIELVGLSDQVKSRIKMYLSARNCTSTIGQVIMGLVCNPPSPGEESYERFSKERRTIQDSYKKRAKLTTEVLNSMEGVKCNEVQGAMYAFPRITLPQRAIEEAKVQGIPPDEFYCWQVLEKTGSYMIPGCAFDMNGSGNHYYFRITIILPENKFIPMLERLKTFHQDFMTKYKDT